MQLSKRLLAVAQMVTKGSRLVDVGTDHGYIPIYLQQQGEIVSAIAMDLKAGPLERAQQNIAAYQLEQDIETRLSDGLTALQLDEADAVVIAGMGGTLMIRILTAGEAVLRGIKEVILQPQSDVEQVRRFLGEHNYQIIKEDMVWEDGKYYPIMKAVHGSQDWDKDIEYRYGRYLLEQQHPVLLRYLQKELQTLQKIQQHIRVAGTAKSNVRVMEIKEEESDVKAALKYYEV